MTNQSRPKLNLELTGKNGNAFALIGYFRKEAKRSGWTSEEIEEVTNELTSGTYEELLDKLMDL